MRHAPSRRRASKIIRALSGVLLAALVSAATAQDFSETRLREGKEAYRAHRFPEAVNQFRIAAFGFLDRPPLLCESLVYLSLSEEAAGRQPDAQATVRRLLDVERRLPGCADANLDSGVRADFESRFRSRLPLPALAAGTSPAARPTPTPAAPTPEPSPASRRPGQNEGATGGDIDVQPRIKKSVPPVYPRAAREAGVGGTVILRVLVSETGRPVQVEVARGVRADLDDAALTAMQWWTFDPALKNGRAVRAWMTVEIPFRPH